MIRFQLLDTSDIPDAVAAMLATPDEFPGRYDIGPFDDKELQDPAQVYVTGADEVEAAHVLVLMLNKFEVAWEAL